MSGPETVQPQSPEINTLYGSGHQTRHKWHKSPHMKFPIDLENLVTIEDCRSDRKSWLSNNTVTKPQIQSHWLNVKHKPLIDYLIHFTQIYLTQIYLTQRQRLCSSANPSPTPNTTHWKPQLQATCSGFWLNSQTPSHIQKSASPSNSRRRR